MVELPNEEKAEIARAIAAIGDEGEIGEAGRRFSA
jgi:hypothetical protein